MSTMEVDKEKWLTHLWENCCVTRFQPRPIPTETLDWILEAGCHTASPWNLQPWQFIVVRSEVKRSLVLRYCPEPGPAASAPVIVVALGDPQAWKRAPGRLAELTQCGRLAPGNDALHLERIRRQWSVGHTSRVLAIAQTYAALQQICLAGLAYDVHSWWIDEFDGPGLARVLHIPDSLLVVGLLALGYCSECTALPGPCLARTIFAEAYGLAWQPAGQPGGCEGKEERGECDEDDRADSTENPPGPCS